mmetsp:Transcript_126743/g.253365  ORF Transcript_126743/g.253365 Transcript_126743/m.253365 type:complete len:234 (-) Transcript_126743:705-1406(-)
MSPFLEMAFKCSTPPIGIVPTDFALVLNSQTMKLVQPERDWFSIPSEWQVQWIVDRPLLLNFAAEVRTDVHAVVKHLVIIAVVLVCLHLLGGLALLLLQVLNRLMYGIAQQVVPLCRMAFKFCNAPVLQLTVNNELALFLERQLLCLFNLPLILLASLVMLHAGLVVEQPVRRQAEEFVFVGCLFPAWYTSVTPTFLKLLVELKLKLFNANKRLGAQEEAPKVANDGFQILSV